MATIVLANTFSAGGTIFASEHNTNFSTIYDDFNGNITDINIASGAAIDDSKLNLTTIVQAVTVAGAFQTTGATTIGNATGDALTYHPSAWTLTNAVSITGTWTDLGTVTTVDINGNISPVQAIDDGNNARDGFTFTVDGFDSGETFSVNWFLTRSDFEGGSIPIGSTLGGNAFGFGVINFARADDGNFPGPIFEGNTGFQQTPLEFFGGVQVVPDPAEWAVEFGAGITAKFVTSGDNIGGPPNVLPLSSITIGGTIIPIDTTSLLLVGAQLTAAWMIPVIIAGIGIAIVIARKF